jgi:UDP-3-O-[3-hydroxymyristoyl] glucosamine N-acyltransferase
MTDDRFFPRHGPFTLGEIAIGADAQLSIDAQSGVSMRGVASLEKAQGDELSVFLDARYADAFANSHAGAIITSRKLASLPRNGALLLLANDPRLAFALAGLMFYPPDIAEPGISPSACIAPSAIVGIDCRIDAGAVIGAGARIGTGCHIGANCVIGPAVEIGDDCVVGANATLTHTLIGSRVHIGSGVVIGSEGFGVVAGPRGLVCSAQIGLVVIGDNVRIGGNCTIDRGAIGDTMIGAGVKIDNLVQIAHNVHIGRNCVIAGQAGIAGSTTIGDNVLIGGQVAVSDHLIVGANARIAGKSGVMRDIPAGQAVAGYPAVPVRQWHRQTLNAAQATLKGNSGE